MNAKWLFIFHEHSKQLWFRASLYCVLAVITALLGVALDDAVPKALHDYIKPNAVEQILAIMASSMLVVATFSLTIIVQAYSITATTATPRATQLVTEDGSAQNALAAFIGAFLFSIVGLIALSAGIYGKGGAVVLFAATVAVVVLVVAMLLRWVEHLTRLGRVEESIHLVEAATRSALLKRARRPFLGGHPLRGIPARSFPVNCQAIGYVQYIDMEKLQHIAAYNDIEIYINRLPGNFCDLVHHTVFTSEAVDTKIATAICEALVIGHNRTFPQDPRFGFVVLAEIAVRALSPAINDPGTAIDVVGTSVRLFRDWARERCEQADSAPVHYDRVWAAALKEDDFFEDVFAPINREAAGFREVCIQLQKTLRAIGQFGFSPYEEPAKTWSEELLARCKQHLTPREFIRVQEIAQDLQRAKNKPKIR